MEKENRKEDEQETTVDSSHDETNGNQDVTEELHADQETDQLILDQQERIAELESQIEEMKDAHLRKAAELENIRKRVQREKAQLFESAKVAALEAFLPVNDDLQRTIEALEELEDEKRTAIGDGVRMIGKKFEEVLKRFYVEPIDETGVPFDVDYHDALLRQKPDDETIGSDVVLQVLEKGYRMGERTIRHAKVIVSE